MTTIRLQLENGTFETLKRYAEKKKMTIQEVLRNLVSQLTFDNSSDTEIDTPSWKKPLPQEIIDIMPQRKNVSFNRYEDYKAELEQHCKGDYDSVNRYKYCNRLL